VQQRFLRILLQRAVSPSSPDNGPVEQKAECTCAERVFFWADP